MSKKPNKSNSYDVFMPEDLSKALHKFVVKALTEKHKNVVEDVEDPNYIAETPKIKVPVSSPGVMYKSKSLKLKEFLENRKKKKIK